MGVWLRRVLSHFNLVFNREMESTHLVASEKVQVVGDGYRIADVIRAMQDKEGLEADIVRRTANYKRWIRWASWIGVAGVVVLVIVSWGFPAYKVHLLGVWTVWTLLVIGLITTLEYLRKSLEQTEGLVGLDDAELKQSVASRKQGVHTAEPPEDRVQDQAEDPADGTVK